MAYVPYAQRTSDIYKLVRGGITAVFNDPTDANYVGMVSEITGLDSAEVVESADTKVQQDGGIHGDFFYGRRPIVVTVEVFNAPDTATRDARIDRARRASNAMRGDAVLSWKPFDYATRTYVEMQTKVRRQLPFHESGAGWSKQIQMALVSADSRLYAVTPTVVTGLATSTTTTGNVTIEQQGSDELGPVVLAITGPVTAPVVTNTTTGKVVRFLGGMPSIPGGSTLYVDVLAHRTMLNLGPLGNYDQYLDFVNSTWPFMTTGNNNYVLTGTGMTVGTTQLQVQGASTWV